MVTPFSTPILLNVFNRPDETKKVLSAISEVCPSVLYVHCDGPRIGHEQDVINVEKIKEIVDKNITWPCDVHKKYEKVNLGCGKGPAESMNWFFSENEEGIIIEDDCIPHPDFFYYCSELLARYRDCKQIGVISGTCFSNRNSQKESYRFSAFAGIWGWATWRRTWVLFDYHFDVNEKDFYNRVRPFLQSKSATIYWIQILNKVKSDGWDKTYWDYQFHLAMMYANLVHVLPNKNLVSNIGFNENATHTFDAGSHYANREVDSIMPLIHPHRIVVRHRGDNRSYEMPFYKKIKRRIKTLLINGK